MTIHKHGSAHWSGDIKHGKGTVSTESGVLNQQPYGFNTRFEGVKGTNPEELIGAAHAACFSMALSLMLGEAGYTADAIDTTVALPLPKSRCKVRWRSPASTRNSSMASSTKPKPVARYHSC